MLNVQSKGVANPGPQVSGLELGGLAGSLSAGALSDYLMRKNTGANPKGNVGLRVQVGCPCNCTRHAKPAVQLRCERIVVQVEPFGAMHIAGC